MLSPKKTKTNTRSTSHLLAPFIRRYDPPSYIYHCFARVLISCMHHPLLLGTICSNGGDREKNPLSSTSTFLSLVKKEKKNLLTLHHCQPSPPPYNKDRSLTMTRIVLSNRVGLSYPTISISDVVGYWMDKPKHVTTMIASNTTEDHSFKERLSEEGVVSWTV